MDLTTLQSKPFSVRATSEQKARWKACAEKDGISLNKWMVRACTWQAELDEAEARERVERIAEHERLKAVTFPDQGEKCKHVAKGQFCYQCNGKRW